MATATTNYNLILVEGTDLVNPLTQVNPNFNDIDTQMKANEQAAIQLATELKTGTVHGLTRSVAAPVFRFVATSNFVTGDTFTLDGTPVTAYTTDGSALTDGCFTIGQVVLCLYNSGASTITVLVSGATGVAADAAMLGGELPSYYATASDLATVSGTATAAATAAANAIPKGQVTAIYKVNALPDDPIATAMYCVVE